MLPKRRTILSKLTVTLWTELWRIDLHKTYLNRYDRTWIEIVIGLGALWDWIDTDCVQVSFYSLVNLAGNQTLKYPWIAKSDLQIIFYSCDSYHSSKIYLMQCGAWYFRSFMVAQLSITLLCSQAGWIIL